MATEPTNLRLDIEAKTQAYAIFEHIGLKPAQAVNLFLRQVALNKGIPFDLKIPNEGTLSAMKELENGGGESARNSKDMFEKLGV